jgi:signal transduction histidine kinase
MARPVRVLIVEDSEADVDLLVRELERGGYEPIHARVETAEAMREALARGGWDLVLSDYTLPRFSAPAAFALLQELRLDLPFIIVSGTIGEEAAVDALRAGAHDFIIKDKLARLLPAIEREVREARQRRERIVELKRAEAERERLIRELREAVQARDAFLAIASHELKTPLTALVLQVQSLAQGSLRELLVRTPVEKLEARLATISRQVTRLEGLVRSLLDVVRITSGRLELARESIDLGAIVAEAVARLEELLPLSKSQIAMNLATGVVGSWDRLRLETVVANLLANAVKFGEGRGVDVAVSSDRQRARLTVTDQGIGMSLDAQARVFGKFERAVPEEHYGGLGLGLWIVRQIVGAHAGTIAVSSEAGKGSTFTVELPLAAESDV